MQAVLFRLGRLIWQSDKNQLPSDIWVPGDTYEAEEQIRI